MPPSSRRFVFVVVLLSLLPVHLVLAAGVRKPAPADPGTLSPAVLPGEGINRYDFVYAGEWDTRKPDAQSLFVVRGGKITWSTTIPLHTSSGGVQEFDDATMLPDGNLLYAQMTGAGLIAPDKKVLWEFVCPPGTECHSVQPIGENLVLLALNGAPPVALIIDTSNGRTVKTIPVPTKTTNSHGQYRHIRMTPEHHILVPLLSEGRVIEIDLDGKVLWSVEAKSPWSAERLQNGNTLIAGDAAGYVREVNRAGQTVWEFNRADAPEYRLYNTQCARRLVNGNTIISNWVAGHDVLGDWPHTVQLIEVTPDKKVVWALRSWTDPVDLGPATHVQILNAKDAAEMVNDFAL